MGYNWGVMCFGKIFADGRNPQQGRRMNVRGKFAASAASAACAAASAAAIAISATFNSAAHADHFGGINDTTESYNFAFNEGIPLCEAEGVGGTYYRQACYQSVGLTGPNVSACRFPGGAVLHLSGASHHVYGLPHGLATTPPSPTTGTRRGFSRPAASRGLRRFRRLALWTRETRRCAITPFRNARKGLNTPSPETLFRDVPPPVRRSKPKMKRGSANVRAGGLNL